MHAMAFVRSLARLSAFLHRSEHVVRTPSFAQLIGWPQCLHLGAGHLGPACYRRERAGRLNQAALLYVYLHSINMLRLTVVVRIDGVAIMPLSPLLDTTL